MPTCEPEGGHALELGLLQPLPHPAEGLPAALELRPGLGVAQQVAEGALAAAEHALGEYRLRYAVPLELGADALRQLLRVDLLDLGRPAAPGARRRARRSRRGRGRRRHRLHHHRRVLHVLLLLLLVRVLLLLVVLLLLLVVQARRRGRARERRRRVVLGLEAPRGALGRRGRRQRLRALLQPRHERRLVVRARGLVRRVEGALAVGALGRERRGLQARRGRGVVVRRRHAHRGQLLVAVRRARHLREAQVAEAVVLHDGEAAGDALGDRRLAVRAVRGGELVAHRRDRRQRLQRRQRRVARARAEARRRHALRHGGEGLVGGLRLHRPEVRRVDHARDRDRDGRGRRELARRREQRRASTSLVLLLLLLLFVLLVARVDVALVRRRHDDRGAAGGLALRALAAARRPLLGSAPRSRLLLEGARREQLQRQRRAADVGALRGGLRAGQPALVLLLAELLPGELLQVRVLRVLVVVLVPQPAGVAPAEGDGERGGGRGGGGRLPAAGGAAQPAREGPVAQLPRALLLLPLHALHVAGGLRSLKAAGAAPSAAARCEGPREPAT